MSRRFRFRTLPVLVGLALLGLAGTAVWFWGTDQQVIMMGSGIVLVAWVGVVFLAVLPILLLVYVAIALPVHFVRRYANREKPNTELDGES